MRNSWARTPLIREIQQVFPIEREINNNSMVSQLMMI
jgi:hypothetical protein